MTTTVLTDGRKVQTDECCDLETALGAVSPYQPELSWGGNYVTRWYLICQCPGCASGEHHWSPSGHGVDPDGGHYGCDPCKGTGEFKVEMP